MFCNLLLSFIAQQHFAGSRSSLLALAADCWL
jgi:hypothetical protein